MTFIGKALAATEVIPFTPATYDSAFRASSLPGLPRVTNDSALTIPACYAATTAISEDTAKVPLQIFEFADDGTRKVARQHPIYDLLHTQPNADDGALQWREWMTAIALNRGRAVSEIVPGPRGPVDQLRPLHPDWLSTEKARVGAHLVTRWRYAPPDEKSRVLMRDQLFILSGRFGQGVVTFARRNFELQLAMQRAASEMYGRGLRSPGYLQTSKTLSDPARTNLRAALDEYIGGGERAGRPLLLDDGLEWKTIAWSLDDMEFLASLKHSVADVARWYRIAQHKLQELVQGTHASLSVQAVDYVVDSLMGWTVRWEQAIRRDLLIAKGRYGAEHNLDGLLRGDIKTRYEAYKIAITFGWMTRNEVRDKENMNRLDGLDAPLLPANMAAQVAGGSPGAGPIPSSKAVRAHLRLLVRDGAARIVRKEQATLAKLAEKTDGRGDDWRRGVRDFYREHAEFTARVLRIPDETAEEYAERRAGALIEAGPELLEHPESDVIADLTETALARSELFTEDRREIALALAGEAA